MSEFGRSFGAADTTVRGYLDILEATFWQQYPQAEQPLKAWYGEARKASWQTPADIRAHYPSASFVGNNRVVFNIKGNVYRLIVAIAYRAGIMCIKLIGTHAQYDAVDAATVDLS